MRLGKYPVCQSLKDVSNSSSVRLQVLTLRERVPTTLPPHHLSPLLRPSPNPNPLRVAPSPRPPRWLLRVVQVARRRLVVMRLPLLRRLLPQQRQSRVVGLVGLNMLEG